ncbi:MAG TPA: phosphotransferase [Pseudonocardiaceae bacterium]|nr:phosphotransferase [Pseudonocardiaceae bacterium]
MTRLRRERIAMERAGFVLNRLHVAYEPCSAGPATVVTKVSPNGSVPYEAWFYDSVAPQLPAPRPKYHGAVNDPDIGEPVLVLEDIHSIQGGRWPTARTGTPADVVGVLDAIAPVHAAGWGRPVVTDGLSGWLGGPDEWGSFQDRYREHWTEFAGLFGLALPARVRDLAERLCDGLIDVLTRLDEAPKTIVHGNLHLDNAVFTATDAARPVVLLDWHTVCHATVAVDVARIVTSSLDVSDRRAHETDLLDHYRGRMTELGVPPADLDGLREQYVLTLVVAFAIAVGRLSTSLNGGNRSTIGDGRLIAALLDHDADHMVSR